MGTESAVQCVYGDMHAPLMLSPLSITHDELVRKTA